MEFEARELKEYVEPVTVENLQAGSIYFAVQFLDADMLVPVLEPLIYLGKSLPGTEQGNLCFQSLESYLEGVRFDSATTSERQSFQITSPNSVNHIFEYERALDVLMRCALERRKLSS